MTNDEAADFQDVKAALLAHQMVLLAMMHRLMAPEQHAEFMDFLDFLIEDLFKKPDALPREETEREKMRQGVLEHVALFMASRRR